MNILDALEETGKACRKGWDSDRYVFNDGGQLCNVEGNKFSNMCIFREDWQPYHAVEQIVPKEPGELWMFTDEGGSYPFFTTESGEAFPVQNHLLIRNKSGLAIEIEGMHLGEIIHNQNGWKRLYPEVPKGE